MPSGTFISTQIVASLVERQFRKKFFKDIIKITEVIEDFSDMVAVVGDVAIFPNNEKRPDIIIFTNNPELLFIFEAKLWWPNDCQLREYINLAKKTYPSATIKAFHLIYVDSERIELKDKIERNEIECQVVFLSDFIDIIPMPQQGLIRKELEISNN